MIVRGTTRLCAIIGHPIAQVRSPEVFNEDAARRGLDVVLVPVDVSPAQVGDFVAFARGWHNADGFIVTVPHKRAVVAHLDALTDRAKRLQAVNVVRRDRDGSLTGDMVDGLGFMAAAAAAAAAGKNGFQAHGRSALVIGAGGAGSAIADALCEAGIAKLALQDIDPDRVAAVNGLLGAAYPAVELLDGGGGAREGLGGFDLVVNASPAGMGGTDELPVAEALMATLRPGTLVADVVTEPSMTPFLRAAQARGCRVQTGPEMTEGQVALLGTFMRALA